MLRFSARRGLLLGGIVIALGVPVALADFAPDISEVVYTIAASNADGAGSYTVGLDKGRWYYDLEKDGVGFVWSLPAAVDIKAPNGVVIATLSQGAFFVDADPQVNLSFAVQAGGSTTSFTISSALLSFPSIPNAQGMASAAISISDFNHNAAALNGLGPDGMTYIAQYNGQVPAGTPFTQQIPQIQAPINGSGTADVTVPAVGHTPIAGAVSDMSSEVTFTLTARDLASGTSNYEIIPIPEPSSLLLAVAALLLVRRRA
jgi:hypothetical protein